MLLRQFAQEADRRYAREKRALQSALVSMRPVVRSDAPAVTEMERPAMTVAIWPFVADRQSFLDRFRRAAATAHEELSATQLTAHGDPSCSLVEPLSDEEGQLELVVPVMMPPSVPQGITLRSWPPRRCAAVSCEASQTDVPDLTGMLDALFDWFDQFGQRASAPPLLTIRAAHSGLTIEASWAFGPGCAPAR